MKTFSCLILIAGMMTMVGCDTMNPGRSATKSTSGQSFEFYQLKTYTFDTNEQVAVTENYLGKAFIPGIKKLGIKQVGVFKPRPTEADTVKKLFVLIPFSSFSQFLTFGQELAQDQTYMEAGKAYLKANFDKPPYRRIESTLLEPFKDMPFIKAPALIGDRASRVYELRSYQSATEGYHNSKVDMFNAGGEIKLFESLGFNAVFYARAISGSQMPNLMYMISFSDEASRKAHWDSFVNSPVWTTLKAIPQYLNTVSHIDMILLYPTDYSDY